MGGTATGGRTSEIEMVASRVVQSQSNVCTVIMDNIQKQLDDLMQQVKELKETVITLDKGMVTVKTRTTLFTIVVTAVGFLVAIVELIRTFR